MTWNSIIGLISSVSLFLPALLILVLRLGIYRSFPALLIYYILVGCYNILTQGYVHANNDLVYYYGLLNNLADAPLMLYFLTYFSTSARFTQNMKRIIFVFIGFEALMLVIFGITINIISIIMGPGLLLVIAFCIHFFIRQTRITISHHKATGKAIISAGLLFAYGCYSIIYLMFYVFKTHIEHGVVKQKEVADTYLVYFLVNTISAIMVCVGIFIERTRIQKLNELKKTRKELSIVYKDALPGKPGKIIALDFDKEHWN
ncbi:MAG: hypothetical protein ABUL41_00325 [Chitinophagaceae bacterium]